MNSLFSEMYTQQFSILNGNLKSYTSNGTNPVSNSTESSFSQKCVEMNETINKFLLKLSI